MEQAVVSGIAFNRDEAKISLLGVPDRPGIAYQILGPVADANIDIDVIIRTCRTTAGPTSRSRCTATTTPRPSTRSRPGAARHRRAPRWRATPRSARSRSSASACASHRRRGEQDVPHPRKRGINIQMITTSEIKTSVVIDEKYMELAVRALHKAFTSSSGTPA